MNRTCKVGNRLLKSIRCSAESTVGLLIFQMLLVAQAMAGPTPLTADELIERIDARGAVTGPDVAGRSVPAEATPPAWDVSAVATQLALLDNVDVAAAAVPAGQLPGAVNSSVGTKTIDLRPDSGLVAIRDVRAYADHDGTSALEGALWSRVEGLLGSLAVDPSECSVTIRQLKSMEKLNNPGSAASEPVTHADKLFIRRHFRGIPVAGDKLVLSFVNGDELRKVIGQWRRIDYGQSRLGTRLTLDQVVQRGVDEVVSASREKSIILAPGLPVRLWTQYTTVPVVHGTYALQLQGVIAVPAAAPEGGHKWSTYTFALD